MPVWKQTVVTLLIALAGLLAWGAVDPEARPRLLSLGLPEAMLPQALFLAAAPAAGESGPQAAPGSGRPGGQPPQGGPSGAPPQGGPSGAPAQAGPGGGGRGPGGFNAGPVQVVTAPVGEAATNDRVSAIGTGEAIRTVALFPRSVGMVDAILFTAGERVAADQPLVRLDSDAEDIALRRAELAVEDARAKVARYDTLVANRTLAAVDRDTARSELATAELALRDARLQLDRRVIRAPFDGVIGLTDIAVGEMVTSTTEIAVLDDRSELKVAFRVPESFAARVRPGQDVTANTPSLPGERFTGTVTALGSRIEPDSRTLVVQAVLDNPGDVLRPGMSFAVSLAFAGEMRLAVPALAVQWDRSGSFVWRVAGDAVERVAVTILERTADQVLVAGEIKIGERVVVEGVQKLRPGAKIAEAGAPAAAPPAAADTQATAGRRPS